MNAKYEMAHEEAELSAEITRNYEQYAGSDQARDERGQLTDVLAQTFEQRMNRGLEKYLDLSRAAGHATLSSYVEQ
jgi:hypothetical protein